VFVTSDVAASTSTAVAVDRQCGALLGIELELGRMRLKRLLELNSREQIFALRTADRVTNSVALSPQANNTN
jgi:hypothetical protein